MDWEVVLKSIDELVFQQTGKHLDSLQMEILKGVFNSHTKSGCHTHLKRTEPMIVS